MRVTIRCFATVRELLGQDRLELDVPDGTTVARLKALLAERAERAERAEALAALPVACAVNRQYAEPEQELADGDEVAFIPPISGGSGVSERFRFDLVDGPLDPRPLEAEVRTDSDGAIATFSGVTRDHNQGQAVRSLQYEAYGEMVAGVMQKIFEEAAERFEIGRARVAHRLGEVPIGEASVVVVVASAHRGPAFEACRYLMDRLKVQAPIFKRELLEGEGGARWVGDLPEDTPRA